MKHDHAKILKNRITTTFVRFLVLFVLANSVVIGRRMADYPVGFEYYGLIRGDADVELQPLLCFIPVIVLSAVISSAMLRSRPKQALGELINMFGMIVTWIMLLHQCHQWGSIRDGGSMYWLTGVPFLGYACYLTGSNIRALRTPVRNRT
jgi:hypothetical protein